MMLMKAFIQTHVVAKDATGHTGAVFDIKLTINGSDSVFSLTAVTGLQCAICRGRGGTSPSLVVSTPTEMV